MLREFIVCLFYLLEGIIIIYCYLFLILMLHEFNIKTSEQLMDTKNILLFQVQVYHIVDHIFFTKSRLFSLFIGLVIILYSVI